MILKWFSLIVKQFSLILNDFQAVLIDSQWFSWFSVILEWLSALLTDSWAILMILGDSHGWLIWHLCNSSGTYHQSNQSNLVTTLFLFAKLWLLHNCGTNVLDTHKHIDCDTQPHHVYTIDTEQMQILIWQAPNFIFMCLCVCLILLKIKGLFVEVMPSANNVTRAHSYVIFAT